MNYSFKIGRITVSVQSLLMLTFSVFYILKMQRAFSGVTLQGGIWNYIQLFWIALGFVLFGVYIARFINSSVVMTLLLYSLTALANAFVFLYMNQTDIFRFLMIPYAFCILVIACTDGFHCDVASNIILTVTFYIIAAMFIVSMFSRGVYSTKTGAVADVYYVLGLLPLMMIWTKKLKILPMAVCGFAVLTSGKRTGILAFALMVAGYYLVNIILSKNISSQLGDLLKLAVIVALFVALFYFVNSRFNGNLLVRLTRAVEDQDTSGRSQRWNHIISEFRETTVLEWLFGHGHGAVYRDFGGNAHNDFLEIVYDYGISSLLFYVAFLVCTIKEWIGMLLARYEYAPQFLMAILFSAALLSFSFYMIDSTYVTSGMLCIGMIMTDYKKKHTPYHALVRDCAALREK